MWEIEKFDGRIQGYTEEVRFRVLNHFSLRTGVIPTVFEYSSPLGTIGTSAVFSYTTFESQLLWGICRISILRICRKDRYSVHIIHWPVLAFFHTISCSFEEKMVTLVIETESVGNFILLQKKKSSELWKTFHIVQILRWIKIRTMCV